MSHIYPRETVEYVYFKSILAEGQVPTSAEFSLSPGLTRPVIWKPLDIVNGKFAFLLDGTLPAGSYRLWVRLPEAPEASVIEVGRIQLT